MVKRIGEFAGFCPHFFMDCSGVGLLFDRIIKEAFFIANELLINEQITDREVRVIGENGEQLGIMSRMEALKAAEEEFPV